MFLNCWHTGCFHFPILIFYVRTFVVPLPTAWNPEAKPIRSIKLAWEIFPFLLSVFVRINVGREEGNKPACLFVDVSVSSWRWQAAFLTIYFTLVKRSLAWAQMVLGKQMGQSFCSPLKDWFYINEDYRFWYEEDWIRLNLCFCDFIISIKWYKKHKWLFFILFAKLP